MSPTSEQQPSNSRDNNNDANKDQQSSSGEEKDIEAPPVTAGVDATQQRRPFPPSPLPPSLPQVPGTTKTSPPSRITGSGSTVRQEQQQARRSASGGSWSGRDLMKVADTLDHVTVTPAWSLHAALGALAPSSPSTPNTSPSARIVYQIATTQSTSLLICGCAGSRHLPLAPGAASAAPMSPNDVGSGNVGSGTSAPISGAGPAQARETIASLGPLNISRHGLSWQTWHPGRHSHHGPGARGRTRSLSRSHPHASSGFGGEGDGMFGTHHHEMLEYLLGDVVGALAGADKAPAVLAVRASLSEK